MVGPKPKQFYLFRQGEGRVYKVEHLLQVAAGLEILQVLLETVPDPGHGGLDQLVGKVEFQEAEDEGDDVARQMASSLAQPGQVDSQAVADDRQAAAGDVRQPGEG